MVIDEHMDQFPGEVEIWYCSTPALPALCGMKEFVESSASGSI